MVTETLIKPGETKKLATGDSQVEFILRRLHSLAGLFPLGLFLAFHMAANNAAVKGPEAFNFVINLLRSLPYLEIIEISILAIPFLFHGLYGLIITPAFARSNVIVYATERNWAYYFQRLTGIVLFVFIAVHVWQLKFNEDLDFNIVAQTLQRPIWTATYIIGVVASVYHFSNGLWNFFISWGITIGKRAQRVSAVLCGVIGIALLGLGLSAVWTFYSADLAEGNLNEKTAEMVQVKQAPLDVVMQKTQAAPATSEVTSGKTN